MNRLQLFSKEVVLEDKRLMKLDYSLTERLMETEENTPYYGVKITKYVEDQIETDEISGISTSREEVVSILNKLYQFDVTPISMAEIVDELVEQGA